MARKKPDALKKVLPYTFRDERLLKLALTHSSYANELMTPDAADNERLEFLGDAVLESVTSDFLYRTYPDEPEGSLSKRRVALVCEQNLDHCARQIGLQDYLYLGKGEEKTGGRQRPSVVSDAMEALIGAVYLDGGYAAASALIHALILENGSAPVTYRNPKSELQEFLQARGSTVPEYIDAGSSGPDHDKTYYIHLRIDGADVTTASGHTKKAAEQQAARQALEKLRAD